MAEIILLIGFLLLIVAGTMYLMSDEDLFGSAYPIYMIGVMAVLIGTIFL